MKGFLQGLGISTGLITAPIFLIVGLVLAIMLSCCVCSIFSQNITEEFDKLVTPTVISLPVATPE